MTTPYGSERGHAHSPQEDPLYDEKFDAAVPQAVQFDAENLMAAPEVERYLGMC